MRAYLEHVADRRLARGLIVPDGASKTALPQGLPGVQPPTPRHLIRFTNRDR